MRVFHLDYETFSEANLPDVGAYRYAEDPTTQILMAAIADQSEGPYLWVHPDHRDVMASDPRANALIRTMFGMREPFQIYAHNAQFERAITTYRAKHDFGYSRPIPVEAWRCTAALGRRVALHGDLEGLAKDLDLPEQKDPRGKALIKLFSMPSKDGHRILPATRPEEFREFCEYCLQDVRTEMAVHRELRHAELSGLPLTMSQLDTKLNDRGLPVDLESARHAASLVDEFLGQKTVEFDHETGLKPTQREKVKQLLAAEGIPLTDMQQPTLEAALEKYTEDTRGRQILKSYTELNYSAAKKVHAIVACANKDGRVRGTLLFYGAATGRSAGRLIQPQNFKRPTIPDREHYNYQAILASRPDLATLKLFGNPLEIIASSIRHFIHAGEGKKFFNADYSSIEARIVCWLAGQENALEDFREGVDQYKKMARAIYGLGPLDDVEKRQRDLGKQAVLGCGYQMWAPRFQETCAAYQIIVDEELAKKAVLTYRENFPMVVNMWAEYDALAQKAILHPGKAFKSSTSTVTFQCKQKFGRVMLFMTLPSGRPICYPSPALVHDKKRGRLKIQFYGRIKDKHWGRADTYGGKLVENATQGMAADIMGFGAANAEDNGYPIVTLIHDEAIALKTGKGKTAERFIELLTEVPSWAKGLPIDAEGGEVDFYGGRKENPDKPPSDVAYTDFSAEKNNRGSKQKSKDYNQNES